MEFGFTRDEEEFRRAVRDLVESELPPDMLMPVVNLAEDIYREEVWPVHQRMAQRMGEKGWLALGWPEEYGGKGEHPFLSAIFQEELRYRGAPGWDPQGVSMVAPLLLQSGTEEQRREHLPGIARGEVTWCQGFSEPQAGSDLASVQTGAVRKGDVFVINGQKLWTSGAHLADWCHLLARTDRETPKKQQGLTYFLVDMGSPGITVRRIEDMCNGHSLCEVFFDNVEVPGNNVLGRINGGWDVALSLLNFERGGNVGQAALIRGFFDLLVRYLKERRMIDDPVVQQHLANIVIDMETARMLAYQSVWLGSEGLPMTSQASSTKLFCSEASQRCANAMVNLLGSFGPLKGGSKWAALQGRVVHWYLQSFSGTLARGTSEIQRMILATRGLGLPRN